MSAKDDLQKKIQSLRDQLRQAEESLRNIRDEEAQQNASWKVGERVEHPRTGRVFEIRRVSAFVRDIPRYWGHQVKKDGSAGVNEFELYWLREKN